MLILASGEELTVGIFAKMLLMVMRNSGPWPKLAPLPSDAPGYDVSVMNWPEEHLAVRVSRCRVHGSSTIVDIRNENTGDRVCLDLPADGSVFRDGMTLREVVEQVARPAVKRLRQEIRLQTPDVAGFTADLVSLCKRYNARIFPRRDDKCTYVSVEIGPESGPEGPIWLDFKRISPDGAKRIR